MHQIKLQTAYGKNYVYWLKSQIASDDKHEYR